MVKADEADAAKELSSILKERRDLYLRSPDEIKQTEVAQAMGISQPQLSRIERGTVAIENTRKLKPEQLLALLRGYRIETEEAYAIAEKLKLELPPRANEAYARATLSGPRSRHLGTVSAGKDGNGNSHDPKVVPIPGWIAEKYNPDDIFVLTVDGDSMTCKQVHDSIPEGSEVYFHSKLEPKPGEVVAVWLEAEGMGVIKICRPAEGYTVLESYNHRHQPIVVDEANPGRIQGVYLGKSEPSKFRF